MRGVVVCVILPIPTIEELAARILLDEVVRRKRRRGAEKSVGQRYGERHAVLSGGGKPSPTLAGNGKGGMGGGPRNDPV